MRACSDLGFGPTFRLGMAACLALSTSCSAFAQDRETWRCDVPNAHYDAVHLPIWDKTTSISGRIDFHQGHFGPEWHSIAKIGFTDSKLADGDCHCSGLFVRGWEGQGLGFFLLVDGQTPEEFDLGRKYDTPITFKISIDPAGLMTVAVGKEHLETKTAMLPHPERDTLMMSCSGADVSFLNVNPQ